MFTDISLCPGGAMMFHESVAEFDSNAASIPAQNTEADTKVIETIKSELKDYETQKDIQYCPISALTEKLRPCYDLVHILSRIPLNPDTKEEAIDTLEKISSSVDTIAETIRMCLVKQSAMLAYMVHDYHWALEPLSSYLGWFIKNYNRVLGQGYGVYTRNVLHFSPLDSYAVNRALNLFVTSADSLTVVPFDISRLYDITNYDRNTRIFSSTEDLINCLFNDKERFDRLAKTTPDSDDLENLIYRCSNRDYVATVSDNNFLNSDIIKYISRTLRLVKCGCYELQCELSNPEEATLQGIISRIRPLMVGAINIFYVGTIKLFSDSIQIKNVMDNREDLKRYVESAMSISG